MFEIRITRKRKKRTGRTKQRNNKKITIKKVVKPKKELTQEQLQKTLIGISGFIVMVAFFLIFYSIKFASLLGVIVGTVFIVINAWFMFHVFMDKIDEE